MASQTTITITHDKEATVDLKNQYQATTDKPRAEANQLENLMRGLAMGNRMASMAVAIDDGDAVAASGTVTFSSLSTANDTFLINGVTFTAVASGATGNQWNVGTTGPTAAANLAAAINGSATGLVSGVVAATVSTNVVTIKALIKGQAGNAVTIAKGTDAGTVMTVSGARLTGGAASNNSTSVTYKYGV